MVDPSLVERLQQLHNQLHLVEVRQQPLVEVRLQQVVVQQQEVALRQEVLR